MNRRIICRGEFTKFAATITPIGTSRRPHDGDDQIETQRFVIRPTEKGYHLIDRSIGLSVGRFESITEAKARMASLNAPGTKDWRP